MLHSTFQKLHDAGACQDRYKLFAKKMGGIKTYGKEKPIPLVRILDEMGVEDCLWVFRATLEPSQNVSIEFACRCAEHVLHHFEDLYPYDKRPRLAIEAARKVKAAAGDAAWAAGATERQWQIGELRILLSSDEGGSNGSRS